MSQEQGGDPRVLEIHKIQDLLEKTLNFPRFDTLRSEAQREWMEVELMAAEGHINEAVRRGREILRYYRLEVLDRDLEATKELFWKLEKRLLSCGEYDEVDKELTRLEVALSEIPTVVSEDYRDRRAEDEHLRNLRFALTPLFRRLMEVRSTEIERSKQESQQEQEERERRRDENRARANGGSGTKVSSGSKGSKKR